MRGDADGEETGNGCGAKARLCGGTRTEKKPGTGKRLRGWRDADGEETGIGCGANARICGGMRTERRPARGMRLGAGTAETL